VALVVVVNTIRLTVIARRQEIEIMQLVGATRWFVRWPFVIEGLFEGAAAGLLAFLVLGGVDVAAVLRLRATMPFLPVAGPGDAVLPLLGWVLAAGLGVGSAGSLIAIRRFLTA
jgi:cell division transport system permease protein